MLVTVKAHSLCFNMSGLSIHYEFFKCPVIIIRVMKQVVIPRSIFHGIFYVIAKHVERICDHAIYFNKLRPVMFFL